MNKGFCILAQNNSDVDYVRQAYALAVSIHKFNKDQKVSLSARSNQSRGLWGDMRFEKGDYFGGDKTTFSGSIGKRFSNHLTLYGSANQNIIAMPNQKEFTANVYGLTAEGALNRKWFG